MEKKNETAIITSEKLDAISFEYTIISEKGNFSECDDKCGCEDCDVND